MMVESDSGKLSFPSLSSGGFQHAMKLVRLVAESLYREHGIGEYWQFCVAVRNMSQAELETRAPLLVAYLQQMQQMQAHEVQREGERLAALRGGSSEEEKAQADVTGATGFEPVSQIPMMAPSSVMQSSFAPEKDGREEAEVEMMQPPMKEHHHTVEVEGEEEGPDPPHFSDDPDDPPQLSYPITQASYSTSLSSSHHSQVVVELPPLPPDAWTIDAAQAAMVEKAVLDFAAAPLLSPVSSHSPAATTALLLPRFSHNSASPSSSLSSPSRSPSPSRHCPGRRAVRRRTRRRPPSPCRMCKGVAGAGGGQGGRGVDVAAVAALAHVVRVCVPLPLFGGEPPLEHQRAEQAQRAE